MLERVLILGLGEAGTIFAAALSAAGASVRGFDIKQNTPAGLREISARATKAGVDLGGTPARLAGDVDIVLSTVTASQALAAAGSVCENQTAGMLYVDLNSTSPMVKLQAAAVIEAGGGRYVDGAAMDTVPNYGAAVPIFVSGPYSAPATKLLNPLGFSLTPVGTSVGDASTIKMMRSIVVKGIEALCAEAFLGAERAGVANEVMGSLQRTYPGMKWDDVSAYHLSRMAGHGQRRAEELRACANTLETLDVDPFLARAIAGRQQWSADLGLRRFVASNEPLSVKNYAVAVLAAQNQCDEE